MTNDTIAEIFPEQSLSPEQLQINFHILALDDVARKFEAVWGAGRLPTLVSPETRLKWKTQIEKLRTAILANDLPAVVELAAGTMRGWTALEAQALRGGHRPIAPDVWEVRHPDSGQIYRITRNLNEARAQAAPGTVTYTLEEVACILETRQLVNQPKEARPLRSCVPFGYDWANGDEIPF